MTKLQSQLWIDSKVEGYNMSHLFGFILAVILLRVGMVVLGMETSAYFDSVAFLIVFGGTFCAAIITYPISDLVKMLQAFVRIAKKNPEEREVTVQQIIKLAQDAQKSKKALMDAAETPTLNPFLKDGIELMLSGFTREDIESIMTERIFRDREREESYGNLLKTISKYPPAFGLVGTVLGLVHVMRGVSGGADAATVGLQMALALVATFYGLIFTNFVLVPASENLINKSTMNLTHRELILEGLLLIFESRSPMVVQEVLNSYLPPLKRKDYIGISGKKERVAAA